MATIGSPARTQPRPGGLVRPGIASVPLPTVELEVRPAFDFLVAACSDCGELDDLLPDDRRWLVESRKRFAAEMAGNACIEVCAGMVFEVSRMLVDRHDISLARHVVDLVDSMPDSELIEWIMGELLDDPDVGTLTRRALDGDRAAFVELQGKLDAMKGHQVLDGELADIAPATRQVLHWWLPLYEAIEPRVTRMLERDVAAWRREDVGRDPFAFVEKATNGLRMVNEQRTRRILLVPTYFGRPYNSMTRVGDVQVICYPIADSSLGSADRLAPPSSTLRLHRALGDESRLRILKLLAERDRYMTEISNELELRKPTVSHHLAALRSAGLVTVTAQGNMTYYSLRRDRAEEAGIELRSFLAR